MQLRKLRNKNCVKDVPYNVWSGYYEIGSLHPKSPIIEVLSEDAGLPPASALFSGYRFFFKADYNKGKAIVNTIPSLSETQVNLWKKELRSLIKASGFSQQEIAIEMARIVSIREKKEIVHTAFTASLSRFINGKDSSFPGWFLHEAERLLPFTEAIGLDSTQTIWDILWQVTGEQLKEEKNHAAFPDISLRIAPQFQISIEQLVEQLQSEKNVLIIGAPKTGRSFAIQWLKKELQYHLEAVPKIVKMESPPNKIDDSIKLFLSPWGLKEVQVLIEQLFASQKLSTSEELHLHQFLDVLDEKWLGFDRRPDTILWLLSDIAVEGLPKNYGEKLRLHNLRYWKRVQNEKEVLSRVSLSTWKDILYSIWMGGNSISKEHFFQILEQHQPSSFALSRENLAHQLEKLRSRSKSRREEAVLFLEKQVQQIDPHELFLVLQQSRLIYEENDRISILYFQSQLPILAEYLSEQVAPLLPDVSFICSQDWWRLLWILSELGLSYQQLLSLLENTPNWMQIDCRRSVLFWMYFSKQRPPKEAVVGAWSIGVWAELQAIFPIKIPFFNRFSDLIQELSFQQAEILPEIETVEDLLFFAPNVTAIFPKREFVQYRDLASLIPVQHAPKTIGEWKEWTDINLAWKALDRKAQLGEAAAIRLLSEGEGKNDPIWQNVPFEKRLLWLGVEESTSLTLYAFQLLLIEAWDPRSSKKVLFLQTAERIGFSEVLEWMKQWCSPLFFGQYLHSEQNITETLSQATIDFCIHFQAYALLESWLDQLWSWSLSFDQIKGNFISWQNKRVFVSNIASNQKQLFQKLAALIFKGAKELYHQERPYLLYRLYFEGQNFARQNKAAWIKKDAHQFLLQQGDITLIQEWIDTAPTSDPLMERYLLQDAQKLSKAWRQDKKVMRRQEILRIAALQKPIPRWALSVASKQITRESDYLWPHWLSPYGADVVFLIRQMILGSSGRNQLWWLRILHRTEPWPAELIQGLQEWSKDREALEWSSRTVHALSAQSTPWLDASDMLSLLKDYLLREHKPQEKWLLTVGENLWRSCHSKLERRIIRQLFSFFEALGEVDFLFQGEWISEKESLLDFLCPIWFERTKVEILEDYLFHPILGERVESHLKRQKNDKAIAQSVKTFLQGGVDRVVDIVQLDNFDELMVQFTFRYPEKQKKLLQELRMIPFVWKEESGRLQAWLRKLEF